MIRSEAANLSFGHLHQSQLSECAQMHRSLATICQHKIRWLVLFVVKIHGKLECGPMPNVMVALPNIGGALCSMLQSLV